MSALSQSYPNVEIIMVNDGSTDTTAALFPSFEKEGARNFSIVDRKFNCFDSDERLKVDFSLSS